MLLGVARLRRLDVLLADNLEVHEEHEVICCNFVCAVPFVGIV